MRARSRRRAAAAASPGAVTRRARARVRRGGDAVQPLRGLVLMRRLHIRLRVGARRVRPAAEAGQDAARAL